MTLAIMQPYLFPYIGYFQLIQAADRFVFYDDVNFIKQGWVNRNRILQTGQPAYFTLPVKAISSYNKINATLVDDRAFGLWRKKFFRTLSFNYSKAPFYKDVITLIENSIEADATFVGEIAKKTVAEIMDYLEIQTEIIWSSSLYNNGHLTAQQRVIDICKKENAATYINVSGGTDLYNHQDFLEQNITLKFIRSNPVVYNQAGNQFYPSLSIIDVLMFCSKQEVKSLLNNYHFF